MSATPPVPSAAPGSGREAGRSTDPALAAGTGPDAEVVPDHDVRAVLAITAFRRLWLALALSSFGDWLGTFAKIGMAAGIAGGDHTRANLAVSAVIILQIAPAALLGPLAGALADRLDRRATMVVGDLLRFGLFASIPVVGTLTWLFVATLLIELVALFWGPAKDATVPNLVPRRQLEAANQVSLAATYGSAPVAGVVFIALTLLAGVLDGFVPALAGSQVNLALYVNAVTFLVAALVVARLDIPPRAPRREGARTSVWRDIVEGWRFVGRNRVLRGLVGGMLGAFAAGGVVIGLGRSLVRDLGAGDPGFGVLAVAVFSGLALGMWTGPRLLSGLSRRRLFALALTAAGGFLLLVGLVPNIVMAALFCLGLGACAGVAWVTGFTLLGLEADDEVRGRTFAFVGSVTRIVLVLVMAAAPALAALLGEHTLRFTAHHALTYNGAALTFGLAGLLLTAAGVLALRSMDDRPGTSLRRDLQRAWRERGRSAGERSGARPPWPGTFVALEGGDGAGKSTQARLLQAWVHEELGREVVLSREPGGTVTGVALREVLLLTKQPLDPRAEALLFAADRAQHVAEVLRPALERGAVVVSDRYVDSSLAYQGAGRALEQADVERLSRWATQGLLPDLTVVLDVDPATARARRGGDAGRGGDDRMEAESVAFHERVRRQFLDLAAREPERYLVVDASGAPEDVAARIRQRLEPLLGSSTTSAGTGPAGATAAPRPASQPATGASS
ncbi:dTMP kinase [Kineococcus xinjiangensis]|uniref:Thymidylate kinase n=1 Tax=Kineococcus xinjiangensis TaxID=512762 RepID=A0A2S6IFG8_9ACTN|nr:dTMP kinase [Kineococcus xinjiangensis]PPK92943.1 dTMP kinase [Kineococcus xinjiangensis]